MTDSLWVYLGEQRVAELEADQGKLSLRYDAPDAA